MEENKSSVPLLDEVILKIGFGKFHVISIIILGFILCFEAIEIILLSFLGPVLSCDWKISLFQSSFITVSVFIGMILGALSFGSLSDKHGRKTIFLIGFLGIFYFSLLCAVSPSFIWILIMRAVIGFFIAGSVVTTPTFIAEIMPISHRGISQMCVLTFWTLGSYYISLLTIVLIPRYGWRMLLVISACPMIFILPAVAWLPESPRYLLLVNRKAEALKVINYIASMNGAEPVSNVNINKYKSSSSIKDILHPPYLLTTVICAYICFVAGTSYFGFVLSSSIINDIPHKCLQNINMVSDRSLYSNSTIDNSCCFVQTWDTMKTVFISITGEFVSYILGIFCIRYIYRKLYILLMLLVNGIVYFLLNLCLSPAYTGMLMMFGRGASVTLIGLQYIYMSEVFPTSIRSFGIGLCTNFIRIGALLSPIMVNGIMVNLSFLVSTLVYSGLNIIGIFLVFFLPLETKNRPVLQSIEDKINGFS